MATNATRMVDVLTSAAMDFAHASAALDDDVIPLSEYLEAEQRFQAIKADVLALLTPEPEPKVAAEKRNWFCPFCGRVIYDTDENLARDHAHKPEPEPEPSDAEVEAGARALYDVMWNDNAWHLQDEYYRKSYRQRSKAVLAAARQARAQGEGEE